MESYIIGIGQKIRSIRKAKEMYASELAKKANVSNGLISRIENGRTIPSVPVLFQIISALDVEPSYFFQQISIDNSFKFLVIRTNETSVIEKEVEAKGFRYDFIFSKQLKSIGFEVVLLTLEPKCKRDLVETDAFEFKYVLSGSCEYIIDGETVKLNAGDAIFFDGKLPHVPKNPYDVPSTMLVIYSYTE